MMNTTTHERIKPVLKWAGGKAGLLEQLNPLFPQKFSRYIEPFFGGGAVFFSFEKLPCSLVNDANPELVHLYQIVRDQPNELMSSLDKLSRAYSEQFYYELRSKKLKKAVEIAARTVFLNKTGFNGLYRQNSRGEFNVPFGKREQCPALYDRENLLAVSKRLQNTEIRCEDFETILDKAAAGDFVYCDPPYEPVSTTSSFNAYKANGFSQDEQRRLKQACERATARGAFVIVSNSSARFIAELYEAWDIRTIAARRAINSKAEKRGPVAEVVVLMAPGSFLT